MTSLDVIDLRAGGNGEVVAIARGLPASVPISVMRKLEGGAHVSVSDTPCDIGRSLALHWEDDSRLQYVDGETAGWVEPRGSTLVGASWLRAELARQPRTKPVVRRDFPLDGPAAPLSVLPSKCAWGACGRPIPFDGSGVEIVVTSFERGDCVHLGCNLYDPAKNKFGTPPVATTWGKLDDVPPGPCGVYHFDRTGARFLVQTSLCVVGGKCEALGGDAVGWLGEDVRVGTEG
jgi:hypothetical protein